MADAIDPAVTYVHLADDGRASRLEGGAAFWSKPEAELERYGEGWLVTEYVFDADWPNWERHPRADEFVYLLEGAVDLVLDEAPGERTIALRGRGAVVVPRGAWHTARVHAPSRMLFVTHGEGTEHRPVAAS